MTTKKAVGLFSGGLDSTLAAILVKNQGFETHLLHFTSPFFGYKEENLKKLEEKVKKLDMFFHPVLAGQDYIDGVIKNPVHGMGSAFNPCIDCHRFMLVKAKEFMEQNNASFVFTGEVLGQRPMSQQKRSLNTIEKESGLTGYLVRPLSAGRLRPSIPEEEGILDRKLLMSITGRGRKAQVALAKEFGIKEYSQPAGGCKFTDPNLVKRLEKFTEVNPNYSWRDLSLLTFCRHFYIGGGYYLILTREQKELKDLSPYFDMGIVIEAADHIPSATGLLINYSTDRNNVNEDYLKIAGQVVARYTKAFQQCCANIKMCYFKDRNVFYEDVVEPISEIDLKRYLL